MKVAHATLDLVQPATLKTCGVHAPLRVRQQREVLIDGVGHGGLARNHIGVIKGFPFWSAAFGGALGTFFLEVVSALQKALLLAVGETFKREFVEIAMVGVGGVGAQAHQPKHFGLVGQNCIGEDVGLDHIGQFFVGEVPVVGFLRLQRALCDADRRLHFIDLALEGIGVEPQGLQLHGEQVGWLVGGGEQRVSFGTRHPDAGVSALKALAQ